MLISQAVVFAAWGDARIGTVAHLVLLLAVAYGFASRGPLSLRAEFEHDLQRGWPTMQTVFPAPVVEVDLALLPDQV